MDISLVILRHGDMRQQILQVLNIALTWGDIRQIYQISPPWKVFVVVLRITHISPISVFLREVCNVSGSAKELLKFYENHVLTALKIFLQIFDSHFAKCPAGFYLFSSNFEFANFVLNINLNGLSVSDEVKAISNIK